MWVWMRVRDARMDSGANAYGDVDVYVYMCAEVRVNMIMDVNTDVNVNVYANVDVSVDVDVCVNVFMHVSMHVNMTDDGVLVYMWVRV